MDWHSRGDALGMIAGLGSRRDCRRRTRCCMLPGLVPVRRSRWRRRRCPGLPLFAAFGLSAVAAAQSHALARGVLVFDSRWQTEPCTAVAAGNQHTILL